MLGAASAQAPRVIDFPMVGLAFVELVFVGVVVGVFLVDREGSNGESGLVGVFVVVGGVVFVGIG